MMKHAYICVKPEDSIGVIKVNYWWLKRGLMVPGGLRFISQAACTIIDFQICEVEKLLSVGQTTFTD